MDDASETEGAIVIDRRFRGPPESANGGYACGCLARFLDGPARVTLRSPPPLDTAMRVERGDGSVRLLHDDTLIGEAVHQDLDLEPISRPTFDEAAEATDRFPWKEHHPYPTCFVCGIDRPAGDGLRIFPGPLPGRAVVAAPWVVPPDLTDDEGLARLEIAWSVLDCPSWFGFGAFHTDHGAVLLGRLEARIGSRPRAGERCVVTGWALGRDGRKIHAASALHGESGALHGIAKATWIELG